MVFNENTNLRNYFLKHIRLTFDDLVNEEFYDEFAKVPNIKHSFLVTTSELHRMYSKIDSVRGRLTKGFIKDTIKYHTHREDHIFMAARTDTQVNCEDIVNIKKFTLVVNHKMLCRDILDFITALDEYKAYLTQVVRHEIGHMISEISNDGQSRSAFDERAKQIMNDYDVFREKFGNLTGTDYLREYHNIPYERTADTLGKVDLEEVLRLDKYLNETKKNSPGFEIKIINKRS